MVKIIASSVRKGNVLDLDGSDSALLDNAFELLKAHLTTYHLSPPIAQETEAPGIAKTRSNVSATE